MKSTIRFSIGLLSISLLLYLYSCYEILDIDIPNQEFYVVDAFITDQDTVQNIRLSKTSPEGFNVPENGAQVYIEDSEGNKYEFAGANDNGIYSFDGKLDDVNPLKLVVNINDIIYESTWEEFQDSPEILDLHIEWRRENILDYLEKNQEIDLLEFQIGIDAQSQQTYALWRMEGVYEYHSLPAGEGFIQICWFQEKFSNFFETVITSYAGVSEHQLFEIEADNKFKRYNLILKQYSLDKSSYFYWLAIQKQRETTGSLFDPPLSEIKGNIVNINNTSDRALGNFTLARHTDKRYLISQEDIPIPIPFNYCEELFYNQAIIEIDVPDDCYDCRLWQGDTVPPPGWIDPTI